jgi:DNA-binding MarR family transcriptional regulator
VRDQFTEDGIILDNALAFWVHRVYQAQRNAMYRAFRKHGVELTPEQWAVLVRLWERDGRSQNELSDATFRDKPTMSRMIDNLEERGLVSRRDDRSDGRVRLVHITAKGRELKPKLLPTVRALVDRMMRDIEPADLEITRRTLRRIFDNLS